MRQKQPKVINRRNTKKKTLKKKYVTELGSVKKHKQTQMKIPKNLIRSMTKSNETFANVNVYPCLPFGLERHTDVVLHRTRFSTVECIRYYISIVCNCYYLFLFCINMTQNLKNFKKSTLHIHCLHQKFINAFEFANLKLN